MNGEMYDLLPKLEIISQFGVGYDNIDVREANRRNIVVTNTAGTQTEEVADLAVALLISTIRQLPQAERYLREGRWKQEPYPPSDSLRERKVGILGLGRIGQAWRSDWLASVWIWHTTHAAKLRAVRCCTTRV